MIEIIDAISVRLNEIFENKYPIYLEAVEQGLITPCFFIRPVMALDEDMIRNRKYQLYDFDIIFIPENNTAYRELFAEVSSKLFDYFDSLEIGGRTLPTFERNINVIKDVLHFGVKFKFYSYKGVSDEMMQENMDVSVINNGN